MVLQEAVHVVEGILGAVGVQVLDHVLPRALDAAALQVVPGIQRRLMLVQLVGKLLGCFGVVELLALHPDVHVLRANRQEARPTMVRKVHASMFIVET